MLPRMMTNRDRASLSSVSCKLACDDARSFKTVMIFGKSWWYAALSRWRAFGSATGASFVKIVSACAMNPCIASTNGSKPFRFTAIDRYDRMFSLCTSF